MKELFFIHITVAGLRGRQSCGRSAQPDGGVGNNDSLARYPPEGFPVLRRGSLRHPVPHSCGQHLQIPMGCRQRGNPLLPRPHWWVEYRLVNHYLRRKPTFSEKRGTQKRLICVNNFRVSKAPKFISIANIYDLCSLNLNKWLKSPTLVSERIKPTLVLVLVHYSFSTPTFFCLCKVVLWSFVTI